MVLVLADALNMLGVRERFLVDDVDLLLTLGVVVDIGVYAPWAELAAVVGVGHDAVGSV